MAGYERLPSDAIVVISLPCALSMAAIVLPVAVGAADSDAVASAAACRDAAPGDWDRYRPAKLVSPRIAASED